MGPQGFYLPGGSGENWLPCFYSALEASACLGSWAFLPVCIALNSASIVSFSHPGWGKGRLQVLPFGRAPVECSLAAGGISWLAAVVSEICLGACGFPELPQSDVSGILCLWEPPTISGFACMSTDRDLPADLRYPGSAGDSYNLSKRVQSQENSCLRI